MISRKEAAVVNRVARLSQFGPLKHRLPLTLGTDDKNKI
jgi:hypothetical protein